MYGQRNSPQSVFWLLFIVSQVFGSFCSERRPLNKFIRHYEPLSYTEDEIKSSYLFGKEVKSLNFKAHGRNFNLQLTQDKDTFSPNIQGLTKEARDAINSAVVGHIDDEPNSDVIGSIKNGKFEGTIFSGNDEFTVKPAEHYFDKPQEFHSVIYKAKDVEDNNPEMKAEDMISKMSRTPRSRRRRATSNLDIPDDFELFDHEDDENLRICNISMEADYLFTKAMGNDTGRAIGEMIHLVRVANLKFEEMARTKYWGNTYKVRLMLGHVMAYYESNTPEELKPQNMGVSTFLDFVSDRDYDGYCQAFFLTYRDFDGGITGLSWPEEKRGGICEARRYFIRIYENFNVQKSKSYNSGVVTYKFFGELLPPKVAEIAFLRQVGTAFGAPNDPDTPECQPGGTEGYFIMYDKANNGGQPNNDKFSPCSIRAIVKTLNSDRVRRPLNKDPFPQVIYCLETPKAIVVRRTKCGDGVAHFREQCDCGTEEECRLKEPGGCCNPKTCTLRKGAFCSVNDGPCCDTTTCTHRSANYVCRKGDQCSLTSRCLDLGGFDNYQCPSRLKKADFKPCSMESQVCMDGVCSNSVCARYKLKGCHCTEKGRQCHVCCMFLGQCVPAIHIPIVTTVRLRTPTLPPGTPCLNYTGYCDIFHECKIVNLQEPLDRIDELYFKREDVKTITRKYWWAILLGTAAWIAFIILLIYICTKRTGTSIPKRDPRSMQMSLLRS